MNVLLSSFLTEKWCLVYWEDEESVTVVPGKDVQDCTVGAVTLIKGQYTGEVAAVGKLQYRNC